MADVLMISAHAPRIDRRIVAEANGLAAAGHAVTLLSVPVLADDYGFHPRVRLQAGSLRHAPAAAPPADWWASTKRLARAVLPDAVYRLLHTGYLRWHGADRRLTREFLGMADAGRYDVIHCHDLETLPAAIALRRRGCPAARLVYDAHELFPFQRPERSYQRYWEAVERRCIGQADLVITVNPAVARDMAQRYGVPTPEVIYNSYGAKMDAPPSDARKRFLDHFGAVEAGVRVLFQGHLLAGRNLSNMVRAFADLGKEFDLFVLGDGPLRRPLEDLCADIALDNVHFAAAVPQSQLLHLTGAADLGLIPYDDDGLPNNRLCTPNKLFEFIEAQLPICASDLPELRRIVTGAGIGCVYPMTTPAAIAQAIRDCHRSVQGGRITREACAAAKAAYAWDRQADRLVALYDRLLQAKEV